LKKNSKSRPQFYKKFQNPAQPAQPNQHPYTHTTPPHPTTHHTHHTHTRTHTNTAQRRLKPEGGKKEGARRKIESKPPKNQKQTTTKPGQIRKNFEKFEKI
jgi:hypothetical protein